MYELHIKSLNQALKLGLKLKKGTLDYQVWTKLLDEPYIILNTKLKTTTKNEFEKDFFKVINNSVFGMTMENIRNQKDMKLVTSWEKYAKYVMSILKSYRKTNYAIQNNSKLAIYWYMTLFSHWLFRLKN